MPTDLTAILKLEVPVIVQIAEHVLTVEEVRNLTPGAILELPKDTEDDLDILVNNHGIATGKAVKVGENFGVRITYVGNIKQRIEAMGRCGGGGGGSSNASSDVETEGDADSLAEQMLAGQ